MEKFDKTEIIEEAIEGMVVESSKDITKKGLLILAIAGGIGMTLFVGKKVVRYFKKRNTMVSQEETVNSQEETVTQ